MGRKSTRENKNIYQLSREASVLTREAAAESMVFVSADRIEKIESGRSAPHPEEVLAMTRCYGNPTLCNYYCSHACSIGQEHVPEVREKSLSQVTLEILASLNLLARDKERLIEITVDGVISQDEEEDFEKIRDQLEQLSRTIDSLKLWVESKTTRQKAGQ